MSLLELDQERERLVVTSEHIGANLMELQRDPTREMLDLAILDGVTASRWAAASQSAEQLWTWFTKLTVLLDEANRLRGTRRSLSATQEAELRTLLTGPSIELSDTTVPIHLRRLDDARRASTRCTPDQLIEMMTAAFNDVRDIVAATQFAWDQLVPRVAGARHISRTRYHTDSGHSAFDTSLLPPTLAASRPQRVLSRGIAEAGRDAASRESVHAHRRPGGHRNPALHYYGWMRGARRPSER